MEFPSFLKDHKLANYRSCHLGKGTPPSRVIFQYISIPNINFKLPLKKTKKTPERNNKTKQLHYFFNLYALSD